MGRSQSSVQSDLVNVIAGRVTRLRDCENDGEDNVLRLNTTPGPFWHH